MFVTHIIKATGISGAEKHLLTLLPGLVDEGIDVCLLILEDPAQPVPHFVERAEALGVPAKTVPILHHIDSGLLPRLRWHLEAQRPDILHTHLFHADTYGLLAKGLAGVPYAVSSRHNDDRFRSNRAFKVFNRYVSGSADRLIAISDHIARFTVEVEGLPAQRIVTIPYGLAPTASASSLRVQQRTDWGYDDETPVIGFFGRLVEQKGVDVLLQAFAEV
ncbi:MAG: glycosyltransferase, partial [Chloroflexi bacterium]|nr:glycosyltransferase [Chloroflexota bacterium]